LADAFAGKYYHLDYDWEHYRGNADALLNEVSESNAPAIQRGARGRGKKGGQLWQETKPEKDGKPAETWKEFAGRLAYSANKPGTKVRTPGWSPTLIALESPDSSHVNPDGSRVAPGFSHVRLATFYKNQGKEYVSSPGGDGRNGRLLAGLVNEGWKIRGAVKVKPSKGRAETYSADQWNEIQSKIVRHASDRAEKVSGGIPTADTAQAREPLGERTGPPAKVLRRRSWRLDRDKKRRPGYRQARGQRVPR
jgi:hypothetical protein